MVYISVHIRVLQVSYKEQIHLRRSCLHHRMIRIFFVQFPVFSSTPSFIKFSFIEMLKMFIFCGADSLIKHFNITNFSFEITIMRFSTDLIKIFITLMMETKVQRFHNTIVWLRLDVRIFEAEMMFRRALVFLLIIQYYITKV